MRSVGRPPNRRHIRPRGSGRPLPAGAHPWPAPPAAWRGPLTEHLAPQGLPPPLLHPPATSRRQQARCPAPRPAPPRPAAPPRPVAPAVPGGRMPGRVAGRRRRVAGQGSAAGQCVAARRPQQRRRAAPRGRHPCKQRRGIGEVRALDHMAWQARGEAQGAPWRRATVEALKGVCSGARGGNWWTGARCRTVCRRQQAARHCPRGAPSSNACRSSSAGAAMSPDRSESVPGTAEQEGGRPPPPHSQHSQQAQRRRQLKLGSCSCRPEAFISVLLPHPHPRPPHLLGHFASCPAPPASPRVQATPPRATPSPPGDREMARRSLLAVPAPCRTAAAATARLSTGRPLSPCRWSA